MFYSFFSLKEQQIIPLSSISILMLWNIHQRLVLHYSSYKYLFLEQALCVSKTTKKMSPSSHKLKSSLLLQ